MILELDVQQAHMGDMVQYPHTFDHIVQWSPTPGLRTGTGLWVNWYLAAQKVHNFSLFPFYSELFILFRKITGFSLPHLSITHS